MDCFIVIANLCPVPESIPTGSMKYTGRSYGSVAKYSCPNGYIISGYQQRRCESNGKWTGTPPKCVLRGKCK